MLAIEKHLDYEFSNVGYGLGAIIAGLRHVAKGVLAQTTQVVTMSDISTICCRGKFISRSLLLTIVNRQSLILVLIAYIVYTLRCLR
jgi:hypothetical protein